VAKPKIAYLTYNVSVLVALIFILPFLIIRNWVLRKPILPYFFNLPPSQVERLINKQVVWIQAVSVDETLVAESIIRELIKLHPDYQIVLTTITSAGQRIAEQKLGDLALVTYFPLELPFLMKRFIAKIHPLLYVMAESNFYPNAIRYSKRAGAKIAIINGRVSDGSYQNYLRLKGFAKLVLQQIDLFAMQSVEDANRIGKIGAPLERILVTGNLKFDREYPSFSENQLEIFRKTYGFKKENLIFTAANTYQGEEIIVIQAFLDLLKTEAIHLIIAPHHPERVHEVVLLLEQAKLPYVKRSTGEPAKACKVLLLDTFEEHSLVYAVSDIVLVGGSMVKIKGISGHDILEAAVQEKPVLYGPYMNNFRDSQRLMVEADAGFTVHNAAELIKTIRDITGDQILYRKRAAKAKAAVLTNRGAAEHTALFIDDMLRSNS
jgi:3-deoxy-D-manno-octulosonic-acid transferase